MSEQEEGQGLDLGIDGREREQEFKRLEAQAESQTGSNGDIGQSSSVEKSETGAALVYPVLSQGFNIIFPAWKVTDDECRALSSAYGELVDKYGGNSAFMEKYKEEITAITLTAMIIGPRMKAPRKLEPQPEQQPVGGSGNE